MATNALPSRISTYRNTVFDQIHQSNGEILYKNTINSELFADKYDNKTKKKINFEEELLT